MNKKRISRTATALLILLILCCLFDYFMPGDTPVTSEAKAPTYPAEWNEMSLPQFPNGSVVWSENSADDGVQFEVEVDGSTDDIADFIDDELTENKFDEQEWDDKEDGFSSQYGSNDVDIDVYVRPSPDGNRKRIRISINRKPNVEKRSPTGLASHQIKN